MVCGRRRKSEGTESETWGEGARGDLPCCRGGAGGWRGGRRVQAPGWGWGWGPEPAAFSPPPARPGHICGGWSRAHPGGSAAAQLREGPPIPPLLAGAAGPPWWWEPAADAPCTPPPLRLPGRRAPAVAAGGCQHPRPRGAPAQAPTLPPSQAPTLGRGGGGRGGGNLRGAGCEQGPLITLS